MAGRMTNEEYLKTQQELQWVSAIVQQMDLSGFLENIERAEALGPVMCPGLYRDAMGKLKFIRQTAEAMKRFQDELITLRKQQIKEGLLWLAG